MTAVTEQKLTGGASRYETAIATFVGICALCVSGYTAYVQRQQVRAAVWPILEFQSSNEPDIHFDLANKGVGPAIIRNVVVSVDGQPVANWNEALQKLLGPGVHHYMESDMTGRVFAPGESVEVFAPRGSNGEELTKVDPLWAKINKDRPRIMVEICYSSTLNECWMLRGGGGALSTTTEIGKCPRRSKHSFEQ